MEPSHEASTFKEEGAAAVIEGKRMREKMVSSGRTIENEEMKLMLQRRRNIH